MNDQATLLPTEVPAPSASPTTEEEQPHLVIRPTSGWAALNLKQIWLYRDLLMTLAGRDVKLRYRQTALGAIWVVLQPLIGAGILSFVFNRVANVPTGNIPPFVFAFAGMLGFSVFSSTLTKSSICLITNSALISKVFFPRLVLPISTIFSTLVDFSVSLAMLAFLMLIYHITPGPQILLMPLWLLLIFILSLGCGLFTSALTVSYRDVQFILPVAVNFLTFASPIAYAASFVAAKVPSGVRSLYFLLNPLASLMEAFRWSLLGEGDVNWPYVAYASGLAIFIFVLGAFSFKKMERKFADVI